MTKFEKNFTWLMIVLCMVLFVYDLSAGKYGWAVVQLIVAALNYPMIYADKKRNK